MAAGLGATTRYVAGVCRRWDADNRIEQASSARHCLRGRSRNRSPGNTGRWVAHVPIVCRWKKHASPRRHEGTKARRHGDFWNTPLRGFVVNPPDRHSAGTPEGEHGQGGFAVEDVCHWPVQWDGPTDGAGQDGSRLPIFLRNRPSHGKFS